MARYNVLAVFFALVAVQQCTAQITFTGDAAADFDLSPDDPRYRTLLTSQNTYTVAVSDWMADHNLTTGWDLKSLSVQYDYLTDTLYFGWDCWVICGDADGDGNPDSSTDWGNYKDGVPGTFERMHPEADTAKQAAQEYTTMTLWTNVPANYTPNIWSNYRPDVVIGDSQTGSLDMFNSYVFDYQTYCASATPNACNTRIGTMVRSPYAYINESWPISRLSAAGLYKGGRTGIQNVTLFKYPNATHPDIEFTIPQLSKYGNFNFTPGIDDIIFAYALTLGSGADQCGEETQYPVVLKIPCLIIDSCGVCGGDNSTCLDCNHVPNGLSRYDYCGVCGGDNSSCWDCHHVPKGNGVYDECGICDGDNTTCMDCFQVPNGNAELDACLVCGGDDSSCWDCNHVPNGPGRYDECGVCDGDDSTCWDCQHVPNGLSRYDECGVCDGDSTTCQDCAGTVNGTLVYDDCEVCGGDSSSCWDCKHIPNGPYTYDVCGVCDGDGLSCLDCNGTVNGDLKIDLCNVCGGDNTSCIDCLGIPNGPNHLDDDGECACFYKDTLIFIPDDTWIGTCDRQQNHEFEGYLEVRNNPKARTLLEWFDLRQIILQKHRNFTKEHTNILNAQLSLTVQSVSVWDPVDAELAFHRIEKFASKEATWDCSSGNDASCCNQWRMIGLPPQVVPSYTLTPSFLVNLTAGQSGELNFNVLDELTHFVYNEEDLYYSYILKKVCEGRAGHATFFSEESGFELKPKLTVTFKTYCDVVVPVTPQPPCPEDEWDWDAEL